jgi:hypothetical protein
VAEDRGRHGRELTFSTALLTPGAHHYGMPALNTIFVLVRREQSTQCGQNYLLGGFADF